MPDPNIISPPPEREIPESVYVDALDEAVAVFVDNNILGRVLLMASAYKHSLEQHGADPDQLQVEIEDVLFAVRALDRIAQERGRAWRNKAEKMKGGAV